MTYRLDATACRNPSVTLEREWILTDGQGGYAMATVAGACTRRYHGLLVPATHPPAGRKVFLKAIDAFVQTDGTPIGISCNVYPGAIYPEGHRTIDSFEVDATARWRHEMGEIVVLREVALQPGAVRVTYRNESARPVRLHLHPLLVDRDFHGEQTAVDFDWAAHLNFETEGWRRVDDPKWYYRFEHPREAERGLPDLEDAFCPFELHCELPPGESAMLVVKTFTEIEAWPEAKEEADGWEEALLDATRPFVVRGGGRETILAGYPWFNDWGRDTMIALPGCLLANGRIQQAQETILGYAERMRGGLIPNRFLDDGDGADYNTVDATLWMFEATRRTLLARPDASFAKEIAPFLLASAEAHMEGTDFGIRVDKDGLLTQGGEGLQLTWMDAKIGNWTVTPRTGKPIEVNALWINALSVLAELTDPPQWVGEALQKAMESFGRFWREDLGWFSDVLDPDDGKLRPNCVIALSLASVPFVASQAERTLEAVEKHLLTPVGLRTLAPFEADYKGRYEGPMSQRDAAYHQGTVWPWLLGPYATAVARFGDGSRARRTLRACRPMLSERGMGGVSEVYDGDAPHRAGGCPWQAWSAAELARAWFDLKATHLPSA
ncbi:amylo-alpha-1,6-glucosidase [soil metagenome]